jgi:hypothetical protein
VVAVDEIDVGITGRTEQDRSAWSVAGGSVSGGIVLSEVGFDFDDTGREARVSVAYEDFSEEIASDAAGVASEERAREWNSGTERDGRGHSLEIRMQKLNAKVKIRQWIRGSVAEREERHRAPIQGRPRSVAPGERFTR